MKNIEKWMPTKYVLKNGKLRGSRNPAHLSTSSRLIADIVADEYQRQMPDFASGNLLDLGCGNVPLYLLYRELVDTVTCVDWHNDSEAICFADELHDIENSIPFSSESFETIILSDVLEHISKPQELLHEINRTLVPGGHLIANVPFFYWIHEQPNDFYRYTRYALETLLTRAGLKPVKLIEIGGTPEVLLDLLSKSVVNIKYIGKPMAQCLQFLGGAFYSTALGKRVSSRSSAKTPLGYFFVAQKINAN